MNQRNTIIRPLSNHGMNYLVPPSRFLAYMRGDIPYHETPARRLGSLAHAFLLEGKKDFVVFDGKRNTAAGKADFQRLIESVDGVSSDSESGLLTIVRQDGVKISVLPSTDYEILVGMKQRIKRIFSLGENDLTEIHLDWENPDYHCPCTGRVDIIHRNGDDVIIAELKTTDNINDFVRWDINRYNYDRQMAFYVDGYHAKHGVLPSDALWYVVEKRPPYECAVVRATQNGALGWGKEKYRKYCAIYSECCETEEWPEYGVLEE